MTSHNKKVTYRRFVAMLWEGAFRIYETCSSWCGKKSVASWIICSKANGATASDVNIYLALSPESCVWSRHWNLPTMQWSPTVLKPELPPPLLGYQWMRRATSLIHTSWNKIVLNFSFRLCCYDWWYPSVWRHWLCFKQARGRLTWFCGWRNAREHLAGEPWPKLTLKHCGYA